MIIKPRNLIIKVKGEEIGGQREEKVGDELKSLSFINDKMQ